MLMDQFRVYNGARLRLNVVGFIVLGLLAEASRRQGSGAVHHEP